MQKQVLKARLLSDKVVIEKTPESKDAAELIVSKKCMGSMGEHEVSLSLVEALYLLEDGFITIKDKRGKELNAPGFMKRATSIDKRFLQRFIVFRDLRKRGYMLRPALKYGGDFLVYSKGLKPGKGHSKWLVFVATESERYTWREWVAKNRVAHSVKKNILIGIVDGGNDVTYYEALWKRP